MLNLNNLGQTIGHCLLTIAFLTIAACGQNMSEQQLLDKAKTYLDENKPKAAALELRNVLQKNNKNAEARFLLGSISLTIGDFTTAEKEFGRATLAGWDQQQIQPALASIFIATGRYQKLLDEIINQDDWSAKTRANIAAQRAMAEASLDKSELAKSTLNDARSYKADAFHVFKTTAIFQLAGLQEGDVAKTLELALSHYPDDTEFLLLLAIHNAQINKLDAAADAYKKIISNQPANLISTNIHKARIGLARLQIAENKLDKAEKTLAPLLKNNKNNPEANYLSGLISFSKKNYGQAEEHIRKLLTIMPDHVPSHQLMGKIKFALKEFEQASHHLSQYLKVVPGNKPARILLTQSYIELKEPEQARSALQPLLTSNPNETIPLSLLSQIAFIQGDINTGIRALKKAIKHAPDNIALQKQLAKAYITTGDTKPALIILNKLLSSKNDTEEIQKLIISTHLRAGNIDNAIKVASNMLKIDPENAEIITLNGSLQAANNNPQQARKYFNEALLLHDNLPAATIGLARLETKEDKLEHAIALYTKLTESSQGGIIPMLALAELAEKQKRNNDMLSWLEKTRTAAPQDLKSRMILANYYLRNSQPGKANVYIQEALVFAPEHPELLALQGKILISQKRYHDALPPLKKLAQKHPDSTTAQLLLGETLLRLGKITEARKTLQAALKTQPDSPLATLLLAETEFEAGNYDRSLRYAKKLQRLQPEIFSGYMLEGNVWMAKKIYYRARRAYTRAWQRQQTADMAKRLFLTSKHIVTFDEAIKPLLSWLQQHPDDYTTRLFLASIYQTEKQDARAIMQYEIVLKQAPDDSTTLNNLAWYYSLQNKPEALDLAERAYRSAPENAGIQDTYGWILTQQGQPEKGLRLIKQAMQTFPDNPDVRYHHASALIKSGDHVQGSKLLQELLNQKRHFEGREQAKQLLQKTTQQISHDAADMKK